MVIVPDASVILKWVLPKNISPYQEQALAIRHTCEVGDCQLLVPPLWRYEVGNTLTRIIPETAFELINLCQAVGLEESPTDEAWLQQTIQLVKENNTSFYDAAYHALAINQSAVFVTADEKYVKKISNQSNVLLLKYWA